MGCFLFEHSGKEIGQSRSHDKKMLDRKMERGQPDLLVIHLSVISFFRQGVEASVLP
jgi:hypothetical protein